jgi:SMI1 / KNR4 family (SUKH-1)
MYKFDIINCSQRLTELEISTVEVIIGVNFPASLKNHYLLFNGGEIEGCRFYFIKADANLNEPNGFYLKYFYPIKYGNQDVETLLEENYDELVIKQKVIPKNYIPIGDDISGWPICCRADNGWIYSLNRETLDENGNEELIHICDSLDEFINGMLTNEEFEDML